MSWNLWLAFLVASIVIAVSPGPGAVLSMSTGLRYGFGAALRSIAGLELALLLQLGVVALGLGAVLATSEVAFTVIKFVGAGYLVWLGVQKWRAAPEPIGEGEVRAHSRRQLYAQGVLVNLTNPKAIVFIAALVPQFIVPDLPQWPQFAVIGATMVGVDVIVMSLYALLATRFRPLLRNPRLLRMQNRIFGGLFVGAGAMLAASSR
ncbi:MAG TPA: homoserine/homoserine lactone efflux protein [Thauera sp.]|jgi:homoserine/homoserine lactone efflux protein|uniref:homoserine/homoserine lactone efflux protein n=1 Tax=Thauera sp. WH-2 TaxID=3401574 RepID=UPI000ECC6782|nr:homoserine/homoserine lactone efflux protein [Thauera sp.]HAF54956.1 homoserine/homoserine lactone efflux protein [Thauera sp.]HHW65275.1 homoserine/homoserine lactone efflux protein [Rhodocyclaceae bacterium]